MPSCDTFDLEAELRARRLDLRSADVVEPRVRELAELFPEAVADGKLDIERLALILGDVADDEPEGFGLSWPGKREAIRAAQRPSEATLEPMPDESVNWEETKNVFIEGENLEVLKVLQRSYHGKVKLIYIDPPYNTGKDFVYPDNYADPLGEYLRFSGQVEEDGSRVSANTETSGRYHSAWLSMMWPRLQLARNLLAANGFIAVSIDDNELARLRLVLDEVFGEENFVATLVWQKKYAVSADDPGVGVMHDYVVVYRRSSAARRRLLPRGEAQDSRYQNPDNDPRGRWAADNYVSNKSKDERPTLWYPIIHPRTGAEVWPNPEAVWRYAADRHAANVEQGRLYWGPDESYERPRLKRYLSEVQPGLVPSTWLPFGEVGHNDEAQKETAALVGPKVFTTPKPTRLMGRLLEMFAEEGGLVLDFFAGSGAFGHAVMKRNAVTEDALRYVLVQLPELSRDRNGRETTLAATCRLRLRNAGDQLRVAQEQGDLGFRAYELVSARSPTEARGTLLPGVDSAPSLVTILLMRGYDLCASVEYINVDGVTVVIVEEGALVWIEPGSLNVEVFERVVDLAFGEVVMPESAFGGNDELKLNALQHLKTVNAHRSTPIDLWLV